MLIPCHRSLYTGSSDHDPDCDLNVQTTSHITPSPSSVSSPTLENTSTTNGGQTSALSMTEPTPQTTTIYTGLVTTNTDTTQQHTLLISTTSTLQSTVSGEPVTSTETSKQQTVDVHRTPSSIPQYSKDITATTQPTTNAMSVVTETDLIIPAANNPTSKLKVTPELTPSPNLTTTPTGELESNQ